MKLILTLLSVVLLSCCCQSNQKRLPTKIEYMRIGFENGKEAYLQIQGTGIYEIRFNDLRQQVIESPENSCGDSGYETIAIDVSFFSAITEHEYNIKHLGVEPTPIPDTTTPETPTTF
jgi:hypothetical protein